CRGRLPPPPQSRDRERPPSAPTNGGSRRPSAPGPRPGRTGPPCTATKSREPPEPLAVTSLSPAFCPQTRCCRGKKDLVGLSATSEVITWVVAHGDLSALFRLQYLFQPTGI